MRSWNERLGCSSADGAEAGFAAALDVAVLVGIGVRALFLGHAWALRSAHYTHSYSTVTPAAVRGRLVLRVR